MDQNGARTLARWAFSVGKLYVVKKDEEVKMHIRMTCTALKEFADQEGESAGRQLRLNKATQSISKFAFGRKKMPSCLVPSSEEEKKAVSKALANMKTKDFGNNVVLLDPRTVNAWVDEIRRAAAIQGRALATLVAWFEQHQQEDCPGGVWLDEGPLGDCL